MLKAAQSGKAVNMTELPPPVATGTVVCVTMIPEKLCFICKFPQILSTLADTSVVAQTFLNITG